MGTDGIGPAVVDCDQMPQEMYYEDDGSPSDHNDTDDELTHRCCMSSAVIGILGMIILINATLLPCTMNKEKKPKFISNTVV